MRTLSLLDLGFFIAETQASPKHVAGLQIFKVPEQASAAFAHNVYQDLLTHTDVKAPFDRVIRFSLTPLPHWDTVANVDLTQHIFYHRLPSGKNKPQDLYAFCAKLHEPMMDRSKPLWEIHVIDGLEGGRFAMYQKMHHACADGVTLSRWGAENLAKSATAATPVPMFARAHSGYLARIEKSRQDIFKKLWKDTAGNSRRLRGLGRLGAMLTLETLKLTKNAITPPFITTAKTVLTGEVTAGRQFTATYISMERINRVRALTRSTLNHVALTCLDGALRSYLRDHHGEIKQPLTIQMPVNLRKEGDKSAGNKIGILEVELSQPTEDPYIRLRNIGFSLRGVRALVDSVPAEAIEAYTILTGLAAQMAETFKLSDRLPPLGNTLVSNVPGPANHLYLNGAKMEGMVPVSTLPPSNLLNITLFSYADTLSFGLIATDRLPDLHKLGGYIESAFAALEASLHVVPEPAKKSPRKKKS